MEEPGKTFAPELSPAQSKKWIGRLLIAVVLGLAIWNFVAALTSAAIIPGLARVMESDPQSPLYLGKGDFNVPLMFGAILELCFAAIAALIVSSWAQSRPKAKAVRRQVTSAAPASLSIAAPAPSPSMQPVAPNEPMIPPASAPQREIVPASPPPPPVLPVTTAAAPPKPLAPVKTDKPKKAKEVYYNLVGEPVDDDE